MQEAAPTIDGPSSAGGARSSIVLENIHKRYGSTHAVNNVSISFNAGEVHALLGENGAGKSTIGKIVGGMVAPDDGKIILNGKEIRFRSIAAARDLGIAMAFQELSLAPHLTVRDNICLGTETARRQAHFVRRRSDTELCKQFLDESEIDIDLNSPVGDLSVANQQLVEVIKAIARKPRFLILDEPTAMLGVRENEKLIKIIRNIRAQGAAVIFVTHHVEEVIKVADRVSLMKDGALVESFRMTEGVDASLLVAKLVGGAVRSATRKSAAAIGDEVAKVSNLPMRSGKRAEISIGRGEIVGLYGVVGSGCEQIGHAMVGLADIGPASLTLLGSPFHPRSPAHAAKRGVSYLPSGRAANCILPSRSVRENLMLTQLGASRTYGILSDRMEREQAQQRLKYLKARYADVDHLIVSLSGGNQQKVLFGRSLGRASSLLVLEDPTAGVDIGAKHDIHQLLAARVQEGLSVLLISSDLLETIAIAHVIYTIIGGKIVRRYDNPTIEDEENIVADVLGSFSVTNEPLQSSQALRGQ